MSGKQPVASRLTTWGLRALWLVVTPVGIVAASAASGQTLTQPLVTYLSITGAFYAVAYGVIKPVNTAAAKNAEEHESGADNSGLVVLSGCLTLLLFPLAMALIPAQAVNAALCLMWAAGVFA